MVFRSFIYCLFLCFTLNTVGQNNLTGYEYWFNQDFGSRTTHSLSTTNAVILEDVSSSVPEGLNIINIRAFDDNNMFSSVLSTYFFKTTIQTTLTKEISSYTYWFDDDFANANTATVTNQENVVLTELLTTNNLTNGFHTFHIRFADNSGLKSSVLSHHFYKTPDTQSQNKEIVKYEYWLDNDFNNASQVLTPNQQYIDVSSSINMNQAAVGLHTLNIRFQDNSGAWSSVNSQQVYKVNPSPISQKEIVAYRWWFDEDYQNANTSAVPNTSFLFLSELINANLLTTGLHTLHLQFKDNSGTWSSVNSTHFYQSPASPINNGKITAYRYWLDNDFSDTTHVNLNSPFTNFALLDSLDFTMISKGTYTIHFQFKDELERWSGVTTDTIEKTPLPIPIFSADSLMFCDSATIAFNNESMDGDGYIWDFGDGTTSQDTLPVHTYDNPGVYDVSLTVIDSITLVDSTIVLPDYVGIYETPSSTINVTDNDSICDGEIATLTADQNAFYEWNTNETSQSIQVDTSGDYWVSLENDQFSACSTDSDTVTITVMPIPVADFNYTTSGYTVEFNNLSQNVNDYYWFFDDGNTSTDTDPIHVYGGNDVYNPYLIATNWCGSDTAFATIDLSDVGLITHGKNVDFSYYPNPVRDLLTLSFDSPQEKLQVRLYDSQGKQVDVVLYSGIGNNTYQLKLPQQKGTYFLQVSTKEFDEMVKVIKH